MIYESIISDGLVEDEREGWGCVSHVAGHRLVWGGEVWAAANSGMKPTSSPGPRESPAPGLRHHRTVMHQISILSNTK